MKPFPILETNHFHLRKFEDLDLPWLFRGLSHPDVIRYYGVSFKTLEETKEQLKWFADLEKEETGIWWAISSKTNGQMPGAAGFNNLSQEHRKAEIGFWLLPEHWGNGIIAEIIPEILNYAFVHLNLHRIEAFVEMKNQTCKKVLDKLHFNFEGTMIDCELKAGGFISVDIYSKIADN